MRQATFDHVSEDGVEYEVDGETTIVDRTEADDDEWDVNIGRKTNDDKEDGQAHIKNTQTHEEGWLGNPWKVKNHGRETVIEKYRRRFMQRVENDDEFREAVESLRGKTLACHCKPEPCHGDVILEYLHGDE